MEVPAPKTDHNTCACARLDSPGNTVKQVHMHVQMHKNLSPPDDVWLMWNNSDRVVFVQRWMNASPTHAWMEPPVWTDPVPSPASVCQATPESCASKVSREQRLVYKIRHAAAQQRAVTLMHECVCRLLSRSDYVFACVITGCVGHTWSHFLSIYSSAQSGYNLYICSVFGFLDWLSLIFITWVVCVTLQCEKKRGNKKHSWETSKCRSSSHTHPHMHAHTGGHGL